MANRLINVAKHFIAKISREYHLHNIAKVSSLSPNSPKPRFLQKRFCVAPLRYHQAHKLNSIFTDQPLLHETFLEDAIYRHDSELISTLEMLLFVHAPSDYLPAA